MKTSSKIIIAAWVALAAIGIANHANAYETLTCEAESTLVGTILYGALDGIQYKPSENWEHKIVKKVYHIEARPHEYLKAEVHNKLAGRRDPTLKAGGGYYSGRVNGQFYSVTVDSVVVGTTARRDRIEAEVTKYMDDLCRTQGTANVRYPK